MRAAAARTSFTVSATGADRIETIAGARHAWRFRPHFHAGDEIVRVLAGRARLRFPDACRAVVAGDTVVVPAGVLHRFEPVDGSSLAFSSRFVPPAMNNIATPGPHDTPRPSMYSANKPRTVSMSSVRRAGAISMVEDADMSGHRGKRPHHDSEPMPPALGQS
ncbi:hypothetical protein RHOFW510R12_12170 [Rhodanobacter sp. FW510-R12]|uniref:cupin domain-containing protein n=1 Tax=unclassified Rhodanobacter TaxID=2621553 RepID=UPI0007A99212|nr:MULTISPECIES: cupin domain-containing protein [unclassified Rhodanobacter]KZC18198.1 hypothetical protein RHOFW104R8_07410 [Rhodanobacter sp. FW104-R8]KZC25708.1 hypothetical protein RhoFW510T8_05805 [Rhodanobacter sp. FW510-T8]KZC33620.1 hypothetical protein RhoFW510R10_07225 [Rhodanobacter sp. FW510-R10]